MATIVHQVWINASPAKVFEAISTAEGLSKWWAPHEATETERGLVLSHDPGPAHGVVRQLVLKRVKNKRIEWKCISTQHPKSSPASAWTGTRVFIEITERANVAAMSGFGKDGDRVIVLNFRHAGWDEGSKYFGFCNTSWGAVLQMLKEWCEAKKRRG